MNTYTPLFHTSAGLLSECQLKIPNRHFIPSNLVQTVTTGKNLGLMGCKLPEIRGSSIAFDLNQSLKGAIGEFAERYASSVYNSEQFVIGSFSQLYCKDRLLPLDYFRYYSIPQYELLKQLNVYPLDRDDVIEWTDGYDHLTKERYLIPAFSVYMPYVSRIKMAHNYMVGSTTTGIAAGPTLTQALKSGFCECAERHAFAKFWYLQNEIPYRQYTRKTILRNFSSNRQIRILFQNPFVRLKAFDLSPFSPLETMVVFLFFDYKGVTYQSLGCAARFDKPSALLKATLEAYQGVEYAINLMEKDPYKGSEPDFTAINSFDAHFHFYNKHPELREKSVILHEAALTDDGDKKIFEQNPKCICHGFSRDELHKTHLSHLIYKDITPPDIASIGYSVVRVITPGWSLLTGNHEWPFLGHELAGRSNLFIYYPHPFP